MAEIYQLPENGNNTGTNIPFSIPIGGNGFGFGNGMDNIPVNERHQFTTLL